MPTRSGLVYSIGEALSLSLSASPKKSKKSCKQACLRQNSHSPRLGAPTLVQQTSTTKLPEDRTLSNTKAPSIMDFKYNASDQKHQGSREPPWRKQQEGAPKMYEAALEKSGPSGPPAAVNLRGAMLYQGANTPVYGLPSQGRWPASDGEPLRHTGQINGVFPHPSQLYDSAAAMKQVFPSLEHDKQQLQVKMVKKSMPELPMPTFTTWPPPPPPPPPSPPPPPPPPTTEPMFTLETANDYLQKSEAGLLSPVIPKHDLGGMGWYMPDGTMSQRKPGARKRSTSGEEEESFGLEENVSGQHDAIAAREENAVSHDKSSPPYGNSVLSQQQGTCTPEDQETEELKYSLTVEAYMASPDYYQGLLYTEEYVFDWGKYKGKPFSQVSRCYIESLLASRDLKQLICQHQGLLAALIQFRPYDRHLFNL